MSIPVAIAFGVGSATVYGTSIVAQHRAVHRGESEVNARGLVRVVRDPKWLLAIGGDFIGFLLQIAALAAGPVVLVQPLVVLMLPVALLVGYLTGGPRPRLVDYVSSLAIVGGLGVFEILIGTPGSGHVPRPHRVATVYVIVLVLGMIACVAFANRGPRLKGAVYGAVAGAYFGTLGVLVDAASDRYVRAGLHGLIATPRGIVPLIGIVVLGLGGIVLTQASFQIGALGATLPANLSADPLTAVLLGAVLLREHIPTRPWHLVGYACCLAAVIIGTVRLAVPAAGDAEPAGQTEPAPS